MKEIKVALMGNPNAGKTTVFNALTGSRQHVGNWPGKTVERRQGTFQHAGATIEVHDLPGTYSLTAYSEEEIIARDFLLGAKPSVVVAVVDASNLERNLYLVTQILELGARLILALNMSDVAEVRGYQIDLAALSESLGHSPVLRLTASRNQGLDALKEKILEVARAHEARPAGVAG